MSKYVSTHLKMMNRQIVFNEIKKSKNIFKNEAARLTGISAPTVMKIVDFLLEKEILVNINYTSNSLGRKPNMLTINNNKFFSIGVVYEGDYLTLGIVNLCGEIINFIQTRCGNDFEKSLYKNLDKLIGMSNKDISDLIGIGIGIPCIFDPESKHIIAPLIGIEKSTYFGDVIDKLKEKYNTNVYVDNDLKILAYGEFKSLNLNQNDDLIYMFLGTGLGTGIVLKGEIQRGRNNLAGEIGYMMFDYEESPNKGGWLENKINIENIRSKFNLGENFEEKQNYYDAIEFVSKYLVLAINNLLVCYDIENIILDGPVLDLLSDALIEKTQEKLDKIFFKNIKIKKRSSESLGVFGASQIVTNSWLEDIFNS